MYLFRHPLNAVLCLNEHLLATGDDQGVIKVRTNRRRTIFLTMVNSMD
jgi:hypothetical protein